MSWHTGRMALFDLESTGVQPHYDRVVTAAIVEVGGGQDTRVSEWLVNPGIDIPEGASNIHGVTTEQAVTGGTDAASAIFEIATHLVSCSAHGMPVVGHNVVYDLTMLHAEAWRYGLDGVAGEVAKIAPVVDTMVLDKWADPWRKKAVASRRLIDTCRHYGIELTDEEAHGAKADALAAGRLAWKLARKYPGLTVSAPDLHLEQVGWKREQSESFGAWLVKQGKVDDVERDWPVVPLPTGWSPSAMPAQVDRAAS